MNEKSRPKATPQDPTPIKSEAIVSPGDDDFDALAAMRRRAKAALRLMPLATGYRDPQFGARRDGVA